MVKQLTGILIGAGNRGKDVFGKYALQHPDKIKFIAVAEPIEKRRESFAKEHNIESKYCFESWEDILDKEKFADIVIITTQDNLHTEPAIKAMKKGYDVLLEKPMATDIDECKLLVKISEETSKILQICHVLRYTDFFSTIKSIIQEGKIGQVTNISWRENVSSFHYAHSYIRGNWHNREKSSPMILAKSCHDMDLLYWLVDSRAKKISSFGSLNFFGKNNKPEGSPERCTDGCPYSDTCLYYAPRIYIDIIPLLQVAKKGGKFPTKQIAKLALKYPFLKKIPPFNQISDYSGWPINAVTDDFTINGKMKALKETDYGKCVYSIEDHNVVDHQVVAIEFENKVTATFTMHGFSYEEGRTLRIDGTKGTIKGEFLYSGEKITVYDCLTGKEAIIRDIGISDKNSGHGGGDEKIFETFINNVSSSNRKILTSARESLESHLMAFAADISRIENRVVDLEELR
ncbi:MAG: Gfo/Idh/MocA family protein [Candidatus Heimdallarchaeaceae archaeon]